MRQLTFVLVLALPVAGQTLHPDDPLEFELPPVSADQPANRKLSDYYDAVSHSLRTPGELNRKRAKPVRGQAVNTLGEPLQGAWWVKRHYYQPMSVVEILAGPGDRQPPTQDGPWTVIGAKNEGVTPGFLMSDARQQLFFVKFDPLTNPEMATGADHVSSRLMYALGYHVPENYLIEFSEDLLRVGKDATVADRLGRRRSMTGRDLGELLRKVPKTAAGKYRATASRAISGTSIGPYRYYGRRSDDPNDFVPHEHRRDLRGLAVFAAWLGHDDSRAINTYDAIVSENGREFVKHYILDLGSTLGSGTQQANSARSGGEYLFGWRQSALQLFTLGLAAPRWTRADFPSIASVGRFEYATFDPETWVPEYPNPAFLNRLPDDEFWAAKQIVALRDNEIRAIVRSARYSDPRAEAWIAECLIKRRDKIGKVYFGKVLPIDRFEVISDRLVFADLSQKAGLGESGPFVVQWSHLDNTTGRTTPLTGTSGPAVPIDGGEYLVAHIQNPRRPGQSIEVTLHMAEGASPKVVAIDRRWQPEQAR